MSSCSVERCGARVRSRGLCENHYRRWLRYGDPGQSGQRGRTPTCVGVDGAAFRAVREEHGYGRREFALVCGVPEGAIRSAEFLGRIHPQNAEKVIAAVVRLRAQSRQAEYERRRRAEAAGLSNTSEVAS